MKKEIIQLKSESHHKQYIIDQMKAERKYKEKQLTEQKAEIEKQTQIINAYRHVIDDNNYSNDNSRSVTTTQNNSFDK